MTQPRNKTVTYDRRSFLLDGEPFFILSGSVHYIRTHPSDYSRIFSTLISAGLNTIETYIFWSSHAPRSNNENEYDFSGRKDLWRFLKEAGDVGLKVILRIGPYVCAEVSYGGLPVWLREIEGMELRTWNEGFMREVGRWVKWIGKELVKRKLVWKDGGPVILVQLENEYEMVSEGYEKDGQRYLEWIGGLLKGLNLGVPAIMCYGSAGDCVETINSFYAHEELDEFRKKNKEVPPVWTECWTGWYDVWGVPHHVRDTTDLAYAIARFVAQGGAGFNYYMWFGGTNFERDPMYLQATSYDYDAPIDEFGLPTKKSNHLTALHNVLRERVIPVMMKKRDTDASCTMNNGKVQIYRWGDISLYCNDSEQQAASGVRGVGILQPTSVKIVDVTSHSVLFDTARIAHQHVVHRIKRLICPPGSIQWTSTVKAVPSFLQSRSSVDKGNVHEYKLDELPDALILTKNETDYCYYCALLNIDESIKAGTTITVNIEAADLVRIFINGKLVAHSPTPFYEDRFNNKWNDYGDNAPGFSQTLHFRAEEFGTVYFTIMTCSLGLIKGDWQLGTGRNMLWERKGLLSVPKFTFDGDTLYPITYAEQKWQIYSGVPGDMDLPNYNSDNALLGKALSCPTYYRADIDIGQFLTKSLVLDLFPLSKGLVWVNNFLLGRFWTINGTRPPTGFLDGSRVRTVGGGGGPTQRYYHVPRWVIQLGKNRKVQVEILDETGEGLIDDVALLEVV